MTKSNKHTQGPWKVYTKADKTTWENSYRVAPMGYEISQSNSETAEANATLIAAAPCLLKELEETLAAIKEFQDQCEKDEYTDTDQVHALLDNIHCDFIKAVAKAKGGAE